MKRQRCPKVLDRQFVWNIAALLVATTLVTGCRTTVPPQQTNAVEIDVWPKVERQPVPGGPVLLHNDLGVRKVIGVESGAIALALKPTTNELYLLHPASGLFRVSPTTPAGASKIAAVEDVASGGIPAGMAFAPDGSLFVVANRKVGNNRTQAIIRRSAGPLAREVAWQTVATTEAYPLSGTNFDHLFGGIVVDPAGKWLYVSSGSRTDHGEIESNSGAFPNTREIPLTAKIFRLSATAIDLVLPNNEAALLAQGLIFASGTRNAYDLEFAPNGDLFAIDNGPDADYPDELNWIQGGQHYGFPWKFGDYDNPQQFADYDSGTDVFLHPDFTVVNSGTYRTDPGFPQPVARFTRPVLNHGPDAAQYRGRDGQQHDAYAERMPLHTFSPHRSPLGLVFTTGNTLPITWHSGDTALNAFVLSWGSAGGTLSDTGQDLLHLQLHKEAVTTQIARKLKHPISAVLAADRLYILEFGPGGAIWEITFGQG